MYVTSRVADCDSPVAITRLAVSGPRGSTTPSPRTARAAWVKMS